MESWQRMWTRRVSMAEFSRSWKLLPRVRTRNNEMTFKPRRRSMNFSQTRIPIYNYMPLISPIERKRLFGEGDEREKGWGRERIEPLFSVIHCDNSCTNLALIPDQNRLRQELRQEVFSKLILWVRGIMKLILLFKLRRNLFLIVSRGCTYKSVVECVERNV